jgi:ABC-2 type transport system ATP-binding protein
VATAGGRATITGNATAGSAELEVRGLNPELIGNAAFAAGIPLHLLAPSRASLEEAFMELTADSVEYQGAAHELRQLAHTGTEA